MSLGRPLPRTSQWSEGRGFQRVYSRNPEKQALLAQTLIGLHEDLLQDSHSESEDSKIIARELAIFTNRYPEFLQTNVAVDLEVGGTYNVDPRFLSFASELIKTSE